MYFTISIPSIIAEVRCFIDYFYVTPAYRFKRYEALNVYPSNWDIDRLVIFIKFTAQLWIPVLSVVHISKTKMAAMDFLWNLSCTRIVTAQSRQNAVFFFFLLHTGVITMLPCDIKMQHFFKIKHLIILTKLPYTTECSFFYCTPDFNLCKIKIQHLKKK